MTLWKTVEELGLQDSIEKDQAVLDQIVERNSSTYQGKSHNFKKKFFIDYFNNVKRTEKALENLYELIKYRIENDINYIADLRYLSLKFNCTLEEARHYQEKQRIKAAPSLEKFQNNFGEVEGLLRYNLTIEFIKNIPLKSKDPYEVTLGIIKSLPENGLKYSKSDLVTLVESSRSLFEEMSELFSKKLRRYPRSSLNRNKTVHWKGLLRGMCPSKVRLNLSSSRIGVLQRLIRNERSTKMTSNTKFE